MGGENGITQASGTAPDAEVLIPLVCRCCSAVQPVSLAVLRASKDVPCRSCGTPWDATAIAATIPARILAAESAPANGARPLSEFP